MASLRTHICSLLCYTTFLSLISCYNLPENHVALFIFGDSLFDAGNNNYINTTVNYQANFWPYGETFFKYPTGRFSDGRLIPDFIAEYAGLPLIPPYLQPGNNKFMDGVNFASAGAGALVETHQGFEIYKKGGRKFGFLSLGPLGCIPGMKLLVARNTSSCLEKVTTLAHLHNKALSIALQKLENQLEGFKFANHNFYTSSSERINNPSKYGFKVGNMACCGSGPYRGQSSCGGKRQIKEYQLCEKASEYMFFDSGHPTERANRQFAELLWHGTPKMTWPYNLKALFNFL
ncbi:GDSL esterase/lipase 2-like isoform X2 [Durio zibethinus]|uniref:GDSL esterase/lipase 2-like isoform X2 n=1 Tax=Durio zibethinus TaxID=66656 RepID=A0A6P5Z8L7_DURZI|nr:GDSL esterase/lipase 2-like isoform X2 [Durio zibethinus]